MKAEVIDSSGHSLGETELAISALRSPKPTIRRITSADETRWSRAEAGAQLAALPYPPIVVQLCDEQDTKIEVVDFDFGGRP